MRDAPALHMHSFCTASALLTHRSRHKPVNSFPAIDEISRQLRDNASPPKMSFYGNPCSRYITVRKALAHVLNELRDFWVLRVRIQDDRHEWKDQRTWRSYIYVDHVLTILNLYSVVSERDAITDTETSLAVYGPITRQSECVCVCMSA